MKKTIMIFFVLLFSLVLISCSAKTTQTSVNTNADTNGTKDIKENNSDRDIQINFSGIIEKPIDKAKLIDCWSQK